jgi:peptide deformylase
MQASQLKIINWPDPRLKKVSRPVEVFDDHLAAVAHRMLQLMREARGVGLAAPQVGLNIRLFVINPTGNPGDDRIYVNPVLGDGDGEEMAEEGCLSLPGITANVLRAVNLQLQAQDLNGKMFAEQANGFIPRIWQHENDHLNGILILDRMGPAERLTARKALKELEKQSPKPRKNRQPSS